MNAIHTAHAITCESCGCTRECDGACTTCRVCGAEWIDLTCLHCGPVREDDPAAVRTIRGILDGFAVGNAPLGAICCPLCGEEVAPSWLRAAIAEARSARLAEHDAAVRR